MTAFWACLDPHGQIRHCNKFLTGLTTTTAATYLETTGPIAARKAGGKEEYMPRNESGLYNSAAGKVPSCIIIHLIFNT